MAPASTRARDLNPVELDLPDALSETQAFVAGVAPDPAVRDDDVALREHARSGDLEQVLDAVQRQDGPTFQLT